MRFRRLARINTSETRCDSAREPQHEAYRRESGEEFCGQTHDRERG